MRAQGRVAEPQVQAIDKRREVVVDQLAFEAVTAEQRQGTVVGQLHAPLLVEHQNAGAHALQDQRIERFQADDFTGLLLHQRFADFQASDQALHQQGCGKTQGAEGADLQIVIGIGAMADAQQETRADNADRPDGGNQQADAPSQQRIADSHRNDQQVANGAGHAAASEEQAAQQQYVEQRQAEQLRWMAGVLEEHHQQNVQHQVQPAARAQQVVIGRGQQPVVHVAGDQQHQDDADA
ncbi:hypothetical protein D3C87_1232760 [compost metagenome]